MAAEKIGRARCWNPKCPAPTKARLSLSKAGLAVMTCNGCHSQVFARSELSDEGLRERFIAEAAAEVIAEVMAKPAPQPAAPKPAAAAQEPTPAATATPKPEPAPAAARARGFLGW